MPEEGIGQAKQSDRVDGVDKVGWLALGSIKINFRIQGWGPLS